MRDTRRTVVPISFAAYGGWPIPGRFVAYASVDLTDVEATAVLNLGRRDIEVEMRTRFFVDDCDPSV